MQLAVLDQMNPSRLLAKIDVDAYLHDVTIVVDIINKPPHGRCELSFTISIRLSDRLLTVQCWYCIKAVVRIVKMY